MKITEKELHILKHSLRIEHKDKSYRNHFCTGEGSKDYPICETLVSKGLMNKHRNILNEIHEQWIYSVSEKGRGVVEDVEPSVADRLNLKQDKVHTDLPGKRRTKAHRRNEDD